MRKTNAFSLPLFMIAFLGLVFLPLKLSSQQTAEEARIAAAPDADASPEALGFPEPDGNDAAKNDKDDRDYKDDDIGEGGGGAGSPCAARLRDFVLEWTPAAGAAPEASLLTQEIDGDTYALLMLMPPAETAGARFDLPRETVYVIDTSGSMAGASIREAKSALALALQRLQPRDSFNVIEFNSFTRRLFDASVPATAGNVEEARRWVAGLEADGGTEMLPALQAALDDPAAAGEGLRQVIFITDGAVGNEAELFAFIHAHLGDSRLFTVGIGSAPNSYFRTRAAEFGRGTFTYIGSAEEVAGKMGALFAKLARPALTELKVAWSDPNAEIYPQRIPDLYYGEPIVVVARLLPGFPGEVRLSGSTQGTPWEVPVQALKAAQRSGLDKLWARRKIAEIGNQLALGGEAACSPEATAKPWPSAPDTWAAPPFLAAPATWSWPGTATRTSGSCATSSRATRSGWRRRTGGCAATASPKPQWSTSATAARSPRPWNRR